MIINSSNLVIEGWMASDLGLGGKELLAYAIIHNHSKIGDGWYYGGRAYLAEWLGCNAKTVGSLLQRMVDNGVIERDIMTYACGRLYRYRPIDRSHM